MDEADEQVYGILEGVSRHVTGESKTFDVVRPVDTLRERLLTSDEQVDLSLQQALDVAAENSREFQTQKEAIYLAALNLTLSEFNFDTQWFGGSSADVDGVDDDSGTLTIRDDLAASVNTVSGGTVVASFAQTFLNSIFNGGGFDSSGIFSLSFTQPLMQGFGRRIAREPLNQAERNVVYAVRSFERFRAVESVALVSEYLRVLELEQNLGSVEANLTQASADYERAQALFDASRSDINELDQANQGRLNSESQQLAAENSWQTSLDNFKFSLGLPIDSQINLDIAELAKLATQRVELIEIDERDAIALALSRRFDYRTAVDRVVDAARRVRVAEDALRSILDFSAILQVPTDPNQPFDLDWDNVRWAAGFDLDLALTRLPERNAYRSSLISLEVAMRAREQLEDNIKADIRSALRDIRTQYQTYQVQLSAQRLARRRRDSNAELFDAGRVTQRDVNEARQALLDANIRVTGALVDYAIARLGLIRDLEGLILEPKGLRFDPNLPLPNGPRNEGVQVDPDPAQTDESGR